MMRVSTVLLRLTENAMLNNLVHSFLSWFIRQRIHQIEHFMMYPEDVQQNVLGVNIERAKVSFYGKKYGLAEVDNYEQFRANLPLVGYEDIEPFITRTRNGEQNVLWPSDIRWFAKSSGTTNAKSKFIPVSSDALEDCHFKAGKDMLALFFNNSPESKIFSGRSLRLGGSTQISNINNQAYFGDLSAIIIENFPVWAELRSTPSKEISLMDEWETKLEAIAHSTIKEDVTSLAGVPSWMLVLLHRIIEISGASNIHEVWPNLELYLHGGVSFAPFRKQFSDLLPHPKFEFMEIYNASEGFFGIQDVQGSQEMLLMLDYGIFYEFIPVDEPDKVLPLWEVKTETVYEMVISTNSGLWRYRIGDTIVFTHLKPYRIKISGRTKHYINVFGEELMVGNADEAIESASAVFQCSVKEYSAAPVYMKDKESGAHEWIIEFEQAPKDLGGFVAHLDAELKRRNSDYEAKRHKDMALKMPIVHQAKPGTFYQWLKQKNKLGGQHKVPRLVNDRSIINELLEIHRSLSM